MGAAAGSVAQFIGVLVYEHDMTRALSGLAMGVVGLCIVVAVIAAPFLLLILAETVGCGL